MVLGNAEVELSKTALPESQRFHSIKLIIPAVMCAVGSKPGSQEAQIEKQWLTTRYHAPSDDVNQPVDLNAAALYNELMLDTALKVADDPQRPIWNPSSFFKRFAD